jgi:ABC-type spermidine/putrescine transport system permease subunit I
MILQTIIPLVNWGMGTALIIVFGVVCVALVILVVNMINSDKKKDD